MQNTPIVRLCRLERKGVVLLIFPLFFRKSIYDIDRGMTCDLFYQPSCTQSEHTRLRWILDFPTIPHTFCILFSRDRDHSTFPRENELVRY